MSVQNEIHMQRLSSLESDSENTNSISPVENSELEVSTQEENSVPESVYSSSPHEKEYLNTTTKMARSQHPVSICSLRGIKNLMFGTPTYSDQDWSRQPLIEDEESGSRRGSGDLISDSESQTTLNNPGTEKCTQNEAFRFDKKQFIKDMIIGLADGLTVPFALTAGLSSLGSTHVVVSGGLAELFAGAISMGLGGYMAEKSAITFYNHQLASVTKLVSEEPQLVRYEVRENLESFGLSENVINDATKSLEQSPEVMIDYIMRSCRGELKPDYRQAIVTSITIGLGYLFGGAIPLIPYFFAQDVYSGLQLSIIVMIIALFIFGYVKTCAVVGFSRRENVQLGCWEGMKMVLVGSSAAAIAMGAVKIGDQAIHK